MSNVRFVGALLFVSFLAASTPVAALPPPPAPAPAPAVSGSGSAAAPATPPPPAPTPPANADVLKQLRELKADIDKKIVDLGKRCDAGCKEKKEAPKGPPPSEYCQANSYGCEESQSGGRAVAACTVPGTIKHRLKYVPGRNAYEVACGAPSRTVKDIEEVKAVLGAFSTIIVGDVSKLRTGVPGVGSRPALAKEVEDLGGSVTALYNVLFGEGQPPSDIDGVPLLVYVRGLKDRFTGIEREIASIKDRLDGHDRDFESRNRLTLGAMAVVGLRARGENLLGVLGTFGGVTTWGGYAQLAAGGGIGGGKLNGTVIVGQAELGYLAGDSRGVQFGAGGFGRMAKGVSTFSNGGVDAGLGLRALIPVTDGGTRLQLGVQGYQSFADCYGSGAPGCSGLGLGLTIGVDSGHAPTKTSGSR
jgi:hypothetical protein